MLSLSPIVHTKTPGLGASAGAIIRAFRREQRFLLEYLHRKKPITLPRPQCDTSSVIYCNEVSQVISTVSPSVKWAVRSGFELEGFVNSSPNVSESKEP